MAKFPMRVWQTFSSRMHLFNGCQNPTKALKTAETAETAVDDYWW